MVQPRAHRRLHWRIQYFEAFEIENVDSRIWLPPECTQHCSLLVHGAPRTVGAARRAEVRELRLQRLEGLAQTRLVLLEPPPRDVQP